MEGENENCICTLLGADGWECGQRWPTARALAAHQRHTQGRTHGEPKGVASLVDTNQCFWCGSTHASIETTSKHHMAAAENTTDAWLLLVGFTILSSTFLLTPSAHDVISSLTTQQNSSAILLLWNIRLPRSLIRYQCRNLCRCLWKRSLAKDPRQMESQKGRKGDENTSNSSLEGRRTT